MRVFEAGFWSGGRSVSWRLPNYIREARAELGRLFREEDYPSAGKLREKFSVRLEILPVPTGDDFRVTCQQKSRQESREIDANVRQSLTRGTEDLWKRLREVVSHMVVRLNERETRFHATLVTNISDLVSLLPLLNMNQDPDLERFAAQIRDCLCNYTAQDLKKHDILRATTAAEAAGIVAQMDEVLDPAVPSPRLTIRCRSLGHSCAHVGLHGGPGDAMKRETATAVRIQKARTALLLDHPSSERSSSA